MTQPPASQPPPPASQPPPPASQPPPQPHSAGGSSQVRCAGCRMILTVGAGITEFVCPSYKMPQMLPPELMKKALAPPLLNSNNILHKMTSQQQLQTPAHGVDPSKIQLPCANCMAILKVPHGLARFQCPQCLVDLAVDLSKIKQLFPPPATLPLSTPSRSVLPLPRPILPPPPLEEVNEIVRPAVGESVREMPLAELKNKYQKLLSLDKARNGWEDEYEFSSKQCMHGPNCRLGNFCTVGRRRQEVNVLGGLILPVWGTIEKALSKQARQSHKRLRVVRLETTTDNRRIVGHLVPNAAVESVLQDLAWVPDIDD